MELLRALWDLMTIPVVTVYIVFGILNHITKHEYLKRAALLAGGAVLFFIPETEVGTGEGHAAVSGLAIIAVTAIGAAALFAQMQIVLDGLSALCTDKPDQTSQGQETADTAKNPAHADKPIQKGCNIVHGYLRFLLPLAASRRSRNSPNMANATKPPRNSAKMGTPSSA